MCNMKIIYKNNCFSICVSSATPRSQTPSSTPSSHLHSNSVMDITEEAQATVHRESSEAVSALLASQKAESTALSPYLPLNPSPGFLSPCTPVPLSLRGQSAAGRRAYAAAATATCSAGHHGSWHHSSSPEASATRWSLPTPRSSGKYAGLSIYYYYFYNN